MSIAKLLWGQPLPSLPGLSEDDSATIWIVVPAKRRQTALRRLLRAEKVTNRLRVLLQGGLDRLLGEALGLRGTPLSDAQTHALLARILDQNKEQFHSLHDLVPATRTEDHVAPGVAVRLREMLDYLRLHESEHKLLDSSLDEDGQLKEERRRNYELSQVLERYEQELEAQGWEEGLSLRRKLAEKLESGLQPDSLPDAFILDQPSFLYPLEQRLWEALARLRPVYLLLDGSILELAHKLEQLPNPNFDDLAAVAPSERHIAHLSAWIARTGRRLAGTIALTPPPGAASEEPVRALFDGLVPSSLEAPSIVLWREHDRRREVERLVRTIKRGLVEGKYLPAQIQIAAPFLDPYLPLLRRAFSEAGVACSLPKGEPLWGSAPAGVLRSFLRWLETGLSSDMVGYLGNPAVRRRKIHPDDLRAFCERHQAELPPFPAALLGSEAEGWAEHLCAQPRPLRPFRLDEEARRFRVPGGPNLTQDWTRPLLAAIHSRLSDGGCEAAEATRLAGLLGDLAALELAWSKVEPLRSPQLDPLEGLALLRARLKEDQALTGLLRHTLNDQDPGPRLLAEVANADRALGEIGRLFKNVEELIRFRRESLGLQDQGLTTLRNFLLEQLRGAHLSRAPQKESVVATELLDTRTEQYEILFVLGLTQSEFPPLEMENYLLPDGLPSHLAKPLNRMHEATWLLGRLLRTSRQIVLSCPRYTEDGPALPATPMEDLFRWQAQGRARLGKLAPPPEGWVASLEELARKQPEHPLLPPSLRASIAHGRAALEARRRPHFTPHDGDIGPHPLLAEHSSLYTVSQLEAFQECPHRYFFQHVIKLRPLADIPSELEENRIGTLVHAALARFFGDAGPWHGRSVTAENFEQACQAMLHVAEQVLLESAVDWNTGPVLQAQRREILRGLQEPHDVQGKHGFLKAALLFQRDLIGTLPRWCEFEFGQGETPPLLLRGDVRVSGTIDRIDLDGDELRVWDYKTGFVPRLDQKGSLQIPLYAEAALRQLPPAQADRLQIRGGFIALKKRNERENLDSPREGALVEHLAIEKIKNKWQMTPTAARARIQTAIDETLQIHSTIREGRFHQIDETSETTCERCDYSAICERDPARLKDKLESELPVQPRPPQEIVERIVQATQADLFGDASDDESHGMSAPAPQPLSEEQQFASDIEHSVVLTAGAGSGKTFVLKTRVSRLVRKGISIDAILAITFTRKAAEEIRGRIAQALGEALETGKLDETEITPEERLHIVDARALLPGASLTTIHGLCQQILRMDPLLSQFDDRAKVLGEAHLAELQTMAVEQALSGQSPCAAAVLRLLESAIRLDELKTGLVHLIQDESRLNSLERSMGARGEAEWEKLCQELQARQAEDRGQELKEWLDAWLPDFHAWRMDSETLEKNGRKKPEQALHFHQMSSWIETIAKEAQKKGWLGQRQALRELENFLVAQSDSQIKAGPGRRNFWKELRDKLQSIHWPSLSLGLAREQLGVNHAQDLLRIAREAWRAYARIKQERAVIDHDDQLSRAYRMLCGRFDDPRLKLRQQALLRRLREKFTHLLVDEFQDTDPRQWELLQALIGNRPIELGGEATVFLVGDRKQAIYGFRGGENRVFEQARQELASRGANVHSLRDNYRSSSEVLDAVNGLFQQIFSSEFEKGNPEARRLVDTAVPPERMRAARQGAPGAASILVLPYEKGLGDRKVREALLTARFTSAVLARELPEYQDLGPGKDDGPRIGILCRKVRELILMADALDRYGVHYTVSHGSGFFSLPEVRALENVLRAITDERHSISLAGVLRGPLFGFSDADLADARAALGPFWPQKIWRGAWDDPRGARAHTVLSRWRRAAAVCSTSALLSLIVADSGICAMFEAIGRPEAVANVEKLIDLVYREERQAGGAGLVEIIHWFELQRRAFEGAAPTPGRKTPVTLMTVHGAKGLEFPMVILPFLEKPSPEDRDFVISDLPEAGPVLGLQVEEPENAWKRRSTLLSQLAADNEKKRGGSEEKRLFYVACTRARRYLVLLLRETDKLWEEQTARDALLPEPRRKAIAEGRDAKAWLLHTLRLPPASVLPPRSLELRDGGSVVSFPVWRPEDLPDLSLPRRGALERLLEPDTAGLSVERQAHVVDASRLHLLERCPLAYYLGRVAGLLHDHENDAAIGDVEEERQAVHPLDDSLRRFLEAAGPSMQELLALPDAESEPQVRKLLRMALEEEPSARLVQEVARHLRRLAELPAWRAALEQSPRFEVPLGVRIQQALLEGSIDAVELREDGGLVLHDFKTEDLHGLSPEAAAERSGYERQLQAYAVAAELMGLGNAAEAMLWFTAQGGGAVAVGLTEEHLAQARQTLARAAELSGWTLGQARAAARTDQCRDCQFRLICPEANRVHEPKPEPDEE